MVSSVKGSELFEVYKAMGREAHRKGNREPFSNDLEIRAFREPIRNMLKEFRISSLLDYSYGGYNYNSPGFDGQTTARNYFELKDVYRFVPTRDVDQRRKVDAVLSFDMLQRMFIADLPAMVREMFSLSDRLLIVNTACYAAPSTLPNGENEHVTVRPPQWWKGLFDAVAVEFPAVSVWLICNTSWRTPTAFEVYSAAEWLSSPTFVTTK
jgi:hypothetical protein